MERPHKFWRRKRNNSEVAGSTGEEESSKTLVVRSQKTSEDRRALIEFLENQIIMGTDREYYSVCYPVLLTFLNCLDDEQWSSLRSGIRNPNTRARFAKQSKMIVDVAVQTVHKIVLPALMVIVDLDDTERAGTESESSPPSNSLKDRIALEIDMEASLKHLDPLTREVMVTIADSMASVEKNKDNGQKTGNLLRGLARMMSCCRPKSRFQTGSPHSVTGATPPPCTQGSGITLGSVQARNAEILSDPMFHLAAAKAASEVLRRSSPSPSLSLAPITAVSCPEINTWSPMSDRLSASQAESVASAIVDGFVKDVTEVTERFQSEGAGVEREPLFSRVSRDAKRLYLSLQTRVRVPFAPVACCAKTPVTPDLLRVGLDVEIPSAPELLQADITLVQMDEEELVDKEIDNCANEVLGSLMEACMVVGVVFNRDHQAGVSVGLSPTNDLTHYTSTLMSALQGTSPTFDLTSSEPEDEKRQGTTSAETTMEQDIPTVRKLSTPTFQHYATQNVGEVLLRAERSFAARRMPHLTPQTSHSQINRTPSPSLDNKVDFETEALRLVEVFVSEVAAYAKEVAMGMEAENTAKVSSQDNRVAEDLSRATEEASVPSTTTNERMASASRNIFNDIRMKLAEFFKRGSMTTEESGLTPEEEIAVGAESPAPWAESKNVNEKADMVVSEILSSMKAGLAEKAPSVSSGISEDAVSLEARIFVGEILDTLENFTGTSGTASPLEKRLADDQEVPQTSPVPSHKISTMATIKSPNFRAKATKSVSAAVLQSFVDLHTLVGPSLSLPQMTVTGLNAACLPRVAEEVVELFVITIEDERRTTDQSLRSAQCMPSALQFVEQLQERLRGFYARVLTAIKPKVKDPSESCPELLTLSVSKHFLDTAANNVVQNILTTVQELDNAEGEVAPTLVPPLVRSESSLDASVRIRDIVACLDNITAVGSSTSLKTLLVSPEAMTETLASETFKNAATQRLQELLQKCLCTSRGMEVGAIGSKPATGCLEKAAGELLDIVVCCVKRMLHGSRRSGKSSESATQTGGSVMEISEEEMWCTTRHIYKKLQEKIKACLAVNKAAEVSLTGNTLTRAKESLSQILVAVRDQTGEENIPLKALAGAMLKNIDKLPEDEDDGDKEDAESLTLFDASSDDTRLDYSKASIEGQTSQRSSESELPTTPATLKAYQGGSSSTDLGSSQPRHQGPSAGNSCSRSQLMADVACNVQAKPHGSSLDEYSATAALARLEELVAQGGLQRTTEELLGKLQTLLKSEGSALRSAPAGNSTSDSVLSRGHVRRTGQPLKEASLELIYSFAEEAVKRLLSSVLLPPPSWGFDKEDSLSSSQSGSSSSSRASPSSSYDRSYDDTVSLYTKVLVCQVMSAVEDPSSHSGLDLWKPNVVPTASTSSSKIRLDVRKSRVVPVGSAPSSGTQLDARKAVVVPSFSAPSSETGLDPSWDTGLTDSSFHTPSRDTVTSEDLLADSSVNRKDKATSISDHQAPTTCPVCHSALVQKKGLAKLRERYNNWKHEHAKKKEKSARKMEGTTDAAPFSKDPSIGRQAPAEIVALSAPCWCVPTTKKEKQNMPRKGLLQAFRDTRFCRAIAGCMTVKAH